MTAYQPEIGQAAFGAPWSEHEISPIGEAAISAVLAEIERVHWNHYQRECLFRSEEDSEDWNRLGSGIEWHAYWWGDDDAPEVERPNLTFGGLAIRWYKYPGRGQSADADLVPEAWSDWLIAALTAVRVADRRDF